MTDRSPLAAFAALPADSVWLRPLALLRGDAAATAIEAGTARALAGSSLAFTMVELLALRDRRLVRAVMSLAALRGGAATPSPPLAARLATLLERLAAPRPDWAGISLAQPLVVGVLNVTPDSFSDGGDFIDPGRASAHGRAMLAAGADIIDIGGESTRPGSGAVSPADELARIERVIAELAEAGAVVSIDTRHAAVMAGALAKGARIVNDVTALTHDPASMQVVTTSGAPVVLMHMQGEPGTMQRDPHYDNAPLEIAAYLRDRIAACVAAGIPAERIVVDPGIGFGKNKAHNLEMLERIALLHTLGCGILLGVSRKSIIGRITNALDPKDRLPGSLAGALHGLGQGVQLVRVHDVAETRQAIAVWQAIQSAP